jgi:hypothetical protein
MKIAILLVVITLLASCSSIDVRQTDSLSFDTLFIGKVEDSHKVLLEPNESKAGRIIVGLVSAGPICAIATANTEEGFSNPVAYEYTLSLATDKVGTVVSRSLVDVGSCVEVVSPDDSNLELLIVVPSSQCEASYNKSLKSDAKKQRALVER